MNLQTVHLLLFLFLSSSVFPVCKALPPLLRSPSSFACGCYLIRVLNACCRSVIFWHSWSFCFQTLFIPNIPAGCLQQSMTKAFSKQHRHKRLYGWTLTRWNAVRFLWLWKPSCCHLPCLLASLLSHWHKTHILAISLFHISLYLKEWNEKWLVISVRVGSVSYTLGNFSPNSNTPDRCLPRILISAPP